LRDLPSLLPHCCGRGVTRRNPRDFVTSVSHLPATYVFSMSFLSIVRSILHCCDGRQPHHSHCMLAARLGRACIGDCRPRFLVISLFCAEVTLQQVYRTCQSPPSSLFAFLITTQSILDHPFGRRFCHRSLAQSRPHISCRSRRRGLALRRALVLLLSLLQPRLHQPTFLC
jgi:hypothetical protein